MSGLSLLSRAVVSGGFSTWRFQSSLGSPDVE